MKKIGVCIRVMVLLFAASALFSTSSPAAVNEFKARLNIVFPDGSVMFYTGANSGLIPGERYGVYSGGVRIATVYLTRVDPYSSIASVVEAQRMLSEGVMYSFRYLSGEAGVPGQAPSMMQKIGEEESSGKTTARKEKEEKEEKVETTDVAQKSSRRRTARRSAGQEEESKDELREKGDTSRESRATSSRRSRSAEAAEEEEETPKRTERKKRLASTTTTKTETRKEKPVEEPRRYRGNRILSSDVSRTGMSGLTLVPSARTLREDEARLSAGYYRVSDTEGYYSSSESVTYGYSLRKNTASYYFTFGMTEEAEVFVVARDIEHEEQFYIESATSTNVVRTRYPMDARETEFGVKYSFRVGTRQDRPTNLAAMVSWKRYRIRDNALEITENPEDIGYNENYRRKFIKYGLVGSVVISDLAEAHGYYAWEKESAESPTATYIGSRTNEYRGFGLSYKLEPDLDLMLEYMHYDEESYNYGGYDWDTVEKSIGLRYYPRTDLHIDGAYIMYDEDIDSSGYLEYDDHYFLIRANYLL